MTTTRIWLSLEERIVLPWPYHLEKQFQSALHKEFKKRWWIVYRIPDLGAAYRLYDANVFTQEWKTFQLEYKVVPWLVLNQNKLEDIQHEIFQKLIELWHHPEIVVWSEKLNDYRIIYYSDFMLWLNDKWQYNLK